MIFFRGHRFIEHWMQAWDWNFWLRYRDKRRPQEIYRPYRTGRWWFA